MSEGATTEPSKTTTKSPYEVLRDEKIARNRSRLRELGLLSTTTLTATTRVDRRVGRDDDVVESKVAPIRRSSRRRKRPRRDDAPTVVAVAPTVVPPPRSSRSVFAHAGRIRERHLGRFVSDRSGKAAVVDELVRCSRDDDALPSSVSFNKYDGVLEWRNDVLCLWVNVFDERATSTSTASVRNDFFDQGTKMTWFGGARARDDSPVVQRLLDVARRTHRRDDPNGVLLFCRTFDRRNRARPYGCLGRLAYHRHAPGTRPLEFVWRLSDAEELRRRLTTEYGEVGENDVASLYRRWLTTDAADAPRLSNH